MDIKRLVPIAISIVGVIGVGATAILSAKATPKAIKKNKGSREGTRRINKHRKV